MHACMHGCMDAWMHGRMDAWMHGCMDAWMHGCMAAWMHGYMDAWMHACVHGCMDAWMHGCMYVRTYVCIHMHVGPSETLVIVMFVLMLFWIWFLYLLNVLLLNVLLLINKPWNQAAQVVPQGTTWLQSNWKANYLPFFSESTRISSFPYTCVIYFFWFFCKAWLFI